MTKQEEIIKRMQDRIMKHQQENGFETIFDFLNEDLIELGGANQKPFCTFTINTSGCCPYICNTCDMQPHVEF